MSQDIAPIKKAYYAGLREKADPAIQKALNVHDWDALDSAGMGDLYWYWNNAQIFNTGTWNQFNNVISFNPDGYLQPTDGQALSTALFNLYLAISYELSDSDKQEVNAANQQAQGILNTVVTDYTSAFGAIPPSNSATASSKINYIITQVMTWGASDLTLATFRDSTNPTSLLPNMPLGSEKLVSDLLDYLNQTRSIETIQNAVASQNAQVARCARNLSPTPATATEGWMNSTAPDGTTRILPFLTIAEPTSTIQNGLDGSQGFSVSMDVTKVDEDTVSVSVNGGAGASGFIGWLGLSAGGSASYNSFSFDSDVTSVSLTLTYEGVTKFTPQLSASSYDVGTGTGWWNPKAIKDAANHTPGRSSLAFTTPQTYDFGANGDFGVMEVLAICQPPTIDMVFHNASESSFSSHFSEESHWDVSFLGIPLGGGSQSYSSSKYVYDSTAGTVSVHMAPPPAVIPGNLVTSQAYVLGAGVSWPGSD